MVLERRRADTRLKLLPPGADYGRSVRYFYQEFGETAAALGINAASEKHLLWIAQMALILPLPIPWIVYVQSSSTPMLYFNPQTGLSRARHPLWSRLLDMVHLHRSGSTNDRRNTITNWRVSDRQDEIFAAKRQCLINGSVGRRIAKIARQGSIGMNICRRIMQANDQEQRQHLNALLNSALIQMGQIDCTIGAMMAFKNTSPALYLGELNDYVHELGQRRRLIRNAIDDIRKRFTSVGKSYAKMFFTDTLRDETVESFRSTRTIIGEANGWMGRVRDEILVNRRQANIVRHQERGVVRRTAPRRAMLVRATHMQIKALQRSKALLLRAVGNATGLQTRIQSELSGFDGPSNALFRAHCRGVFDELDDYRHLSTEHIEATKHQLEIL